MGLVMLLYNVVILLRLSTNQSSLQFAEKVLNGEAIDLKTTEAGVNKWRLDLATSLLRESGMFSYWPTILNQLM